MSDASTGQVNTDEARKTYASLPIRRRKFVSLFSGKLPFAASDSRATTTTKDERKARRQNNQG